MKSCRLIGIGMGQIDQLSQKAVEAIQKAPLVAGAERMLSAVGSLVRGKKLVTYDSHKIASAFSSYADTAGIPCALFSGDTGFYSGAGSLCRLLKQEGWNVEIIPGISTPQYFASRLGESWQNWHLVSAHGTDIDIGASLTYSAKTFFLTGGSISLSSIARYLIDHDIQASLSVGSRLGYEEDSGSGELIFSVSPQDLLSRNDYDENLSCLLVSRNMPELPHGALPDDFFIRNDCCSDGQKLVPMTKRLVRAAILSLLSVADGETVWDIGGGTGAVSIDLARSAHCSVHTVEEKDYACDLIRRNREKAGAVNLSLYCGHAPEALKNLPAPHAVFIGGSQGELESILHSIYQKNPAARVLLSAVSLETLSEAERIAEKLKLEYQVTEISVSQSKKAGSHHLMQAQNSIYLISFISG